MCNSHSMVMTYIVGNDVPGGVASNLHPHCVGLTRGVLVEEVAHDAALSNVIAIDAGHPCVDVVVHHIQLQAALCDGDTVVDSDKVTL